MTLVQFFNQHSFLLYAALGLGAALAVLWARRRRVGRLAWVGWLIAVAVAVGGYFVFRTAATRTFESAAEVQRAIASGRPTLVEFYSDF